MSAAGVRLRESVRAGAGRGARAAPRRASRQGASPLPEQRTSGNHAPATGGATEGPNELGRGRRDERPSRRSSTALTPEARRAPSPASARQPPDQKKPRGRSPAHLCSRRSAVRPPLNASPRAPHLVPGFLTWLTSTSRGGAAQPSARISRRAGGSALSDLQAAPGHLHAERGHLRARGDLRVQERPPRALRSIDAHRVLGRASALGRRLSRCRRGGGAP